MPLPEKLFFSIANLAERWNVAQHEVMDHVVTGSLQPSVFVDDIECVRYVDGEPSDLLRISGEVQFIPSMTMLSQKTFWLSGGSYHGNHVWLDLTEPKFELPAPVLFMEAVEISVDDIRVRYAPYVKLYEKEVLNNLTTSPEPALTNHECMTEDLSILNTAWQRYWKNADRMDKSSWHTNEEVENWLIESGFSKKNASAGATIIKPEWARKGGRR